LHDRMKATGAQLLVKTVEDIFSSNVMSKPQAEFMNNELRGAPKIHAEDRKIDWSLNVGAVHNHVRGLSPYPAAWTTLVLPTKKSMCKILQTSISTKGKLSSGRIVVEEDKMFVGCGEGRIEIQRIQPEGKTVMDTKDFLRGARLTEDAHFE